jgi:hypothetical protein
VPATAALSLRRAANASFFIAELRATYFGARGRLKGAIGLIVRSPDKLLIEIRGPGGTPISTFACDGEVISLLELEGPRFLRGAATPRSMARLLPLPLEPNIAVDLLRGKLPLPEGAIRYQTRGKAERLEGEHPTLGTLIITKFSPDHWRWELPDEPLRVDLRAPRPDGIFTDLEIRRGGEEVHLRLTSIDTSGEPPPDAAFTLPVPTGVTVEPL